MVSCGEVAPQPAHPRQQCCQEARLAAEVHQTSPQPGVTHKDVLTKMYTVYIVYNLQIYTHILQMYIPIYLYIYVHLNMRNGSEWFAIVNRGEHNVSATTNSVTQHPYCMIDIPGVQYKVYCAHTAPRSGQQRSAGFEPTASGVLVEPDSNS